MVNPRHCHKVHDPDIAGHDWCSSCCAALQDKDPDLFYLARVGLGCLGVVSELTIQCVPSHELLQHTQVMTRCQVHQQHKQLLQSNRHLRYMWLPYTDTVVVVTCNPYQEVSIQNNATAMITKRQECHSIPLFASAMRCGGSHLPPLQRRLHLGSFLWLLHTKCHHLQRGKRFSLVDSIQTVDVR